MTKNEALKAAIDGGKVKPELTNLLAYVTFEEKSMTFFAHWKDGGKCKFLCNSYKNATWQILPELVSFDEAWKAYESGKTIKSIPGDAEHWLTDGIVDAFTSDQIRGKWQIIDD